MAETELLTDNHTRRIKRLETVVGTFISWTAQSANSPISVTEAAALLKMLEDDGPSEAKTPENDQ